ncbi:uracil-DNA glycosylase [Calidifontibacillus erzurumensis]|uniref:Uracil-DNA glycosylase n=1 Tax=Calidifontibacillus erzurumensis TaxID=2741433 RepID=A0A8J8GBI6_9BACI|nr:uracil-DNA glycosylase [Calidifontibacillus erzurumensis]NSL50880.1 uracil-DNA glycosylase [Calidifontibacillus erzurumensis]
MNKERINCLRCQYFYTTWDQRFPRGCKAFGFKTQQIPADYVFRISGQPCMKFVEKVILKKSKE